MIDVSAMNWNICLSSVITIFITKGEPDMSRELTCGLLIKRINEALEKQANREMQHDGLTLSQTSVLVTIEQSGGDAEISDLCRILGIAQPTVTGIIKRLEQKGYVEMFPDPEDGRRKHFLLTPLGQERCSAAAAKMQSAEERICSNFQSGEREQFIALLKKVDDALRK